MKHACVARPNAADARRATQAVAAYEAKERNAAAARWDGNPQGWPRFWPIALSQTAGLEWTKRRVLLRVPAQNRASASRVSLC